MSNFELNCKLTHSGKSGETPKHLIASYVAAGKIVGYFVFGTFPLDTGLCGKAFLVNIFADVFDGLNRVAEFDVALCVKISGV